MVLFLFPFFMTNDLKEAIPKRLSNPSAELRILDAPDREPEDAQYQWQGGLSSLAEVAEVILASVEARAKAAADAERGEGGAKVVPDEETEEEAS
jgi:hypothetical protein